MGLISDGTTIFDAGAMASGFGGSMTFIKKLTASSSGTLSFVNGASNVVLDGTYKEYLFTFNNIHPATGGTLFHWNMSIDGGTNYNVQKTTTTFRPFHYETASDTPEWAYATDQDLANGTGFQTLVQGLGNANDENSSGTLQLFNPSSTTFIKHFISSVNMQHTSSAPASVNWNAAGYGNTTSAVNAVQFKMASGNIDAGVICLYGIA